ncbi:hypothetical protein MSG28_013299 [Choristoneura fumiferana]|uniref:Uncharacterized protein n=2 Tax=Choristoneura fumiferana TaxID=7141 RepID=A0ACC0KT30_CHOFU|nr:hypothetical protein MSG28_013299 [Choristoneura fumiferana]KAI8439560.1 hypothetical protein MSG28_013299 [Choristoneura fumiferana]
MQEDYFCHHEAEENVHQPLPSLSKAFYVFTDQNPEPGYEKYTHNPHTCHYLVDHGHNHNHNHEHHHDHIEESQKSVAHVMDDNLSRVSKLGSCGRYSGVKSRYMDHFKKIYDLKEKKYGVKEMDWKAYHRLDVIHNFLDGLEADYPSLCTAGVIGSSLEGRDLKVLKISNSAASNASVWMDAGIHAREWIAPAVATYIANHFARNFKDLPTSITNKDWYFLPVMNPDGYEFSHTDNRMWRKNRAWHGGKCIGVDLNRNFSNDWSYGAAKIPFCYLLELRSKKHRFKVPQEEIEETGNEILKGVMALMDKSSVKSFFSRCCQSFKVAPPKKCCATQVWELKFTSEGQRCFVKNLATIGAIDIWKEEPCGMDILVEGPRVKQVSCMLRERCIPYCVAISDVDAMKERERCHIRKASSSCPMDWKNYHRLDTIYAFLDRLACEYPYLCTVCCIGRSYEGRDLKLLKISNGSCNNEGVWLDGAIHAREYILPVMNPDGYEFTHTCDRMWRKNRAHYGECVGVDLNRNFSFGWGEKGEEGSSEDPGNIFYRGPKPFSECESIAVKRKILECGSRFKVFLSFHSYGEVIIFPWATLASPVQTMWNCSKEALPWLSLFTHLRPHVQGRQYKDLMYYAAGTSIDWAYGCANIPYSYMVELRSKEHRFLLPKEEILCTSSEIFCGVLKISNSAASNASVWMDAGIHAREWIAPAVATYIANHFARNFKDLPTTIDIWKEEPCGMDILVEGPRVKQVSCMLRERCIPYCVAISDVDAMKERERCHIRKASSSCPMDWKNYHRLDTIYAFLDRLACEYPYLCTVCCIGRSYEGRDLKLLKISNGSCNNEGVWLDGAIHAREWISAAVVTYIADQLVRNFNCARKSVTILAGERRARKVHLKTLRKILECGSRFKVFLSFHSYGEVIIFPWGYTGEPCSDYVELLEGGTAMAKSIYNTCGHTYKVGSTKDLMYYAAGTSIDWAYGCANIPYSYMVELRSKEHRFLLPKEEILCTSSEIFCGVKTLMSFVDRRCAPVRRTSSCCSFKSICSRE